MGGRKPTVSDEEFLRLFSNSDDPFLTTSEVADEVGFSTNKGAYDRLRELAEEGLLENKKVGSSLAWWISEEGEAYLSQGG